MTHKVHPKLYRIKEMSDWGTRGYYRKPAESLEEDFKIREFLKKKIGRLAVEKVEIERSPGRLTVIIFSARPGLIIGRGGEEIEKLKKEIEKNILKVTPKKKEVKKGNLTNDSAGDLKMEIREIKDPWSSASLSAQWIAQQLEKRMPFRKVLKQGLGKISYNKGFKGARVEVSGRLNGAEMSRREWLSEGRLPRQTLRADIDYAQTEAYCTYGVIGVKVWIYKGDKFD